MMRDFAKDGLGLEPMKLVQAEVLLLLQLGKLDLV
jgi:hypothetical protein